MTAAFVDANERALRRMGDLVERASDGDLARALNEHWTVAAVLGHVAFWDVRQLFLLDKLERGIAFTDADVEPEDVSWINDSTRPLLHAIPAREAARTALRIAGEIDRRLAALPPAVVARTWPADPESLVNPLRAAHREEHLDEIEALLGSRSR